MLMRSNDAAINMMDFPVELTFTIRLLLEGDQNALPSLLFSLTIETPRNSFPLDIALWQVTLGRACSENPENAIDHGVMIKTRTTHRGFLGR